MLATEQFVLNTTKHPSSNSTVALFHKDAFFSLKTDVLVLAALELQICDDYANKLNCELIVEGANGPINLKADKILHDRNITILPDVLNVQFYHV